MNPQRVDGLDALQGLRRAPPWSMDRLLKASPGRIPRPDGADRSSDLIAVAHDNPPISAPPPWRGMPVTPALVRWRIVRDARVRAVIPWRVAADFRTNLLLGAQLQRDLRGGDAPEPPTLTRPLPLLAHSRLGHAPARRPLPARRRSRGHSRHRIPRAPRAFVLVNDEVLAPIYKMGFGSKFDKATTFGTLFPSSLEQPSPAQRERRSVLEKTAILCAGWPLSFTA